MDDGTAVFDRTTDSLQAIKDTGVAAVAGAVGSVTGAVGSVTGAVGSVSGNVTGSIGSLATQAKADVQAEVADAMAATQRALKISVSYASAVFQLALWLEDGTGAIVNITTVGDVDILDHAGTAVIDESAGHWNTQAPTEGADNAIRAERDETSPLLSGGEEYIVQATLDSVAYRAGFNLSAAA